MNQDKKIHLLIAPLIFIVLLYVPVMILKLIPNAYMQEMPEALRLPCALILWTWILRRKKGNAMYFIVWLTLCVLSILMYWKWGVIYHSMMYM